MDCGGAASPLFDLSVGLGRGGQVCSAGTGHTHYGYLSMTTLPPHNAGVPGAASGAGGRRPRETAKATVQARNDMQVRLPGR